MTPSTTTSPQLRAGCYCRISSDPKDKRQGVDRQRQDTADICEMNGWAVAEFYVDNNRSAYNGQRRPHWERLLADIAADKIDVVVAWNQDRAWRKMSDFEALRPVFEPKGVLLACTNIGTIDFANADDMFRVQISTALSEMEIRKMKIRMRRAAKQAAQRGTRKWTVTPFGYGEDGLPDPHVAGLVRQAYADVLAGETILGIARAWNAAGVFGVKGKPWAASSLSLFLRSPRNCGQRSHTYTDEHSGKTVTEIVGKGDWEPLVTEDTWKRVQGVLNGPGRGVGRRGPRQRYLLTSMMTCMRCGPGHRLTGAVVAADRRLYICRNCRRNSALASSVETVVIDALAERLSRPDAVDLVRSDTHDEAEAERLRTERQTLLARKAELADERADGLIDGAGYKRMTDRLDVKLAAITASETDPVRADVLSGVPLGGERAELVAVLEGLTQDRYRAVLDVVAEVSIAPVGKGGRWFKPERVLIDWVKP